jgi:hypothetical protein
MAHDTQQGYFLWTELLARDSAAAPNWLPYVGVLDIDAVFALHFVPV